MQIVIVVVETIVGQLWSVVNLKQDLLYIISYCLLVIFQNGQREQKFFKLMPLLQHCFTADTKFRTSFRTIAISIVTCRRPYIFFLFDFSSTLSRLSSFNRQLEQRHSTHVNRPFRHYGPVNKHKEMRTRLGWTISYKSLDFVHPSLELMPLFTEMRERSIERETFFFLNIS